MPTNRHSLAVFPVLAALALFVGGSCSGTQKPTIPDNPVPPPPPGAATTLGAPQDTQQPPAKTK